MDRWDKKILYQLDLDGRISFSKIAKKVGKSKSFVKYRVENLQRKNILLDFVTIIDTSKLGFQTYDIYLQIIEDKSVEDEICDFLKLIPEINCIQKIIGKYQLYISLFVKYFGDLENFFINFLEKYHKVISSYEILMIYKAYSPAHNYLFGNEMKKINHSKALLCSRPIELSKKEIEILRILEVTPRASFFEISQKIKSSLPIVKKIFESLIQKEIFYYIRPSLDANKLDYLHKNILFNFKPNGLLKIDEIKNYFLSLDSTMFVSYGFGKYDLTGEFVFKNLQEFRDFQEKFFKGYSEYISKVEFYDYYKEIKYSHIPFSDIN